MGRFTMIVREGVSLSLILISITICCLVAKTGSMLMLPKVAYPLNFWQKANTNGKEFDRNIDYRNEKPLLAMKMESPPQGRYKNAKYQNSKRLNFNYLLTIKLKQNLTVYKTNLLRDN